MGIGNGDQARKAGKARKARKRRSLRIVKLSCCDLSVVGGPLSVAAKTKGMGKRVIFFYSMLYALC